MKMRWALVIIFFLVLPIAYAGNTASAIVAYCEHMEYLIEIDIETNKPTCIFDNVSKCDATEFYKGVCDINKIKEIPPRKEGQTVYTEFEKCGEGLIPSEPRYLLDQPKCYKHSLFGEFFNSILSFFGI